MLSCTCAGANGAVEWLPRMGRLVHDRAMAYGPSLTRFEMRWGDARESVRLLSDPEVYLHVFDSVYDDRPFQALFTDGLATVAAGPNGARHELVWYVERAEPVHQDWLRFLSIVIATDQVDLFLRTVPMAVPPSSQSRIAEGSLLTSATFLKSPLRRDALPFDVDGGEAQCLWVLPITEAERRHLQGRGAQFGDILADLLDRNQHPFILDPMRSSYVAE